MKDGQAIVLEDFLSANWVLFENFCSQVDYEAQAIMEEVQKETGQYELLNNEISSI